MTDMLTPQMSHDEAVERFTGGLAPSVDVIAPFNGSDRLRPDGRPKPEFRAELRKIPNAMNAFHTVFNLALPLLYISAAVAIDHPIGWVGAFLAMGVYFQRILTLHHEAAHRLLFSKRAVNDWVGEKFIGLLVFGDGGNGYQVAIPGEEGAGELSAPRFCVDEALGRIGCTGRSRPARGKGPPSRTGDGCPGGAPLKTAPLTLSIRVLVNYYRRLVGNSSRERWVAVRFMT